MSKKLGNILNDLLIAAGVAADDAGLKTLLSNAALSDVPVPDELSKPLLNNLLTVDAAKTNPAIKAHFTGQALSLVDSGLSEFLTANNYTDITEAIKAEPSTYKKIPLVLAKIKEIEAAKVGAVGDDKKKYTDQISALNADLVKIKDEAKKALETADSNYKTKMADMLLGVTLQGFDYSEIYEKPDAMILAKNKLAKAMAEKKVVTKPNDSYDGILLLQEDGATPFYVENKAVDFTTFAKQVLADSKLLKVSGQQPPPPGKNDTVPPPGNKTDRTSFNADIEKASSDFKLGSGQAA